MIYKNLEQISFPIGGIGTGSVGLSGTGRLIDWEIFGRPNKQSYNGYTHFAIKTEEEGAVKDVRIIQGDLPAHYIGNVTTTNLHSGYGFGPDAITMAGLPHYKDIIFKGEYPIAEISFLNDKPEIPYIKMRAFNPFIPLNAEDSSLPIAYFDFFVTNKSSAPKTYTITFSIQNPFSDKKVENHYSKDGDRSYILLTSKDDNKNEWEKGELCIGTDCETAGYQEYWYRGGWNDGLETYWKELSSPGLLKNRRYSDDYDGKQQILFDVASLQVCKEAMPGECVHFRFVLGWYVPVILKNWELKYHPEKKQEDVPTLKQYYGTVYPGVMDICKKAMINADLYYAETKAFRDYLFQCSIGEEEIDAISSNLAVLKSSTVLRLEDGSFYGFEGTMKDSGCCEGSCQHVWNYAYALPFLFPNLERSMRELELKYNVDENGKMDFRLQLPLGQLNHTDFCACVDGQMGAIIKFYREFKICGNKAWLKEHWITLKKIISYAWSENNENKWDPDKTGVISGRQHHTLDMELFGPNAWLEGYYLAALISMAEMAEILGLHEESAEYRKLFEEGKRWTNENLYNGEYFIQKVDIHNDEVLEKFKGQKDLFGESIYEAYWNKETEELKYQIGSGCMIDQMSAQWHADNCNLPEIFDKEKVNQALASIMKYNYVDNVRNLNNTWRLYALNDEGGVIMCSWPDLAGKPGIPLTYNSEMMTGFEYQLAGLLIAEGKEEEGKLLVKRIRERYDGYKRNPYSEIECGSNYARSMASFSLLIAHSGYVFDSYKGMIGFMNIPKKEEYFTVWFLDKAWGTFCIKARTMELKIVRGEIIIKEFRCNILEKLKIENINTENWSQERERVRLNIGLNQKRTLKITF